MASGTYRVVLTATPQRIDNLGASQNLSNAIKLLSGAAQFWYLTGSSAPTAANLDKGFPKSFNPNDERANELSVPVLAADSLWVSGYGEIAIIAKLT